MRSFLLCVLAVAILFLTGCRSNKDDAAKQNDADTSSQTNSKSSKLFPVEGMTHISDNPKYFQSEDQKPISAQSKGLDAAIRPVLVKLFGGAKLIGENEKTQENIHDTELLNSTTYVVRRLLALEDGDELHKALLDENFGISPRLGAKPQHGRKFVVMSLFKHTGGVQYSLVIMLNLEEQTITVKSYKLGSKYDRM